MKISTLKNGAIVTFEKTFPSGMYIVILRVPNGEIYDKVRTDDYQSALTFKRAFLAVAKGL